MKRIGILNSGGDCAGLNAVISSFTKYALSDGYEVYGFIKGFEGVLDKKYIELTNDRIRGISQLLMDEIDTRAPHEFELRNTILGHVQRGGSPNSEDRILAKRLGVAAFDAIKNNMFGSMVSLRGNNIVYVPILDAVNKLKTVPVHDELVEVARKIGISFGD